MRACKPILLAAAVAVAACASGPAREAFVVVEENAEIYDRSLIRRIGIVDDDTLLVEAAAADLYRVRLFPGCVSFADFGTAARLDEIGMGLDRTSRFVIDGRTCPVRSIERVERVRRQPQAETPASGS